MAVPEASRLIREEARRIALMPADKARAELARRLDERLAHPIGSKAHALALDYNAHLVTALREEYERHGRRTCWAAP